MKFTTHPPTIVTLSLAALLSAPFAVALQADKDAAKTLTSLIDPPAAGTQQDQGPSLAVMKEVIEDLIANNSGNSIAVFGESAGPALRAIVEESSLDWLTQVNYTSPLYYLTMSAPIASLQYFSDLERSTRFQYEAFVRGEHPPLKLVGTPATEGASRLLYLDLLDRTISSESLELEERLKMAVGSLAGGLSTPLSRSLITQNTERALGVRGSWDLAILDVAFPTPESITADLPERIALAALDHRASMDILEILSSSPHIEVRRQVAEWLGMEGLPLPGTIDRRLAVLYELSSDSASFVELQADEAIQGIVESSLVQLDIVAATELIAKVGYKTTIGETMSKTLAWLIHNTARTFSSATPEQMEQLYRTVLGSPNSHLKKEFQRIGNLPIEHGLAYFHVTAKASEAARGAALNSIGKSLGMMPTSYPQRASSVLDTLLSNAMQPGEEVRFLGEILFQRLGRTASRERPFVLSALPANRAGEALRWMAAHSSEFGAIAFASPESWKDAGPQMREAFEAEQSSTRLKLIAGAALVNSGAGNEADADAMTKLLVELCKVPSKYEDVEWFLKYNRSGRDPRALPHWDSVTAAIFQDHEVSDAMAAEFELLDNRGSAVHKSVLQAAEQRAILSKGTTTFGNLAGHGLPAMLDDPAMLQPNLVRGWITRKPGVSADITSVVLASGDDDLIEAVMDHLLVGIASSDDYLKALSMADQLLRIPGDEPIQRLLEVTSRSGSSQFVASVEKRLAIRLRIREAALRWSNLASGGTSIDSAKVRVLKLLDSPNSEVRIEAIYGLGTLGAIESLPRLIELVGSEHQAERDAAKETLKLLRDRSANATAPVTRSKELQSPETEE